MLLRRNQFSRPAAREPNGSNWHEREVLPCQLCGCLPSMSGRLETRGIPWQQNFRTPSPTLGAQVDHPWEAPHAQSIPSSMLSLRLRR